VRRTRACRRTDLLLPDYLAGRLSGKATRYLEAHLAACDECRRELGFLRDLACALEGWRAAQAPPGLERRILACVSRAGSPAWREAAVLAALSAASVLVMPLALRFPAGLAIWEGLSAVAAFVAVWAAEYPKKEKKRWGMAARADGL
jgi:anti-sigma factor RsiW